MGVMATYRRLPITGLMYEPHVRNQMAQRNNIHFVDRLHCIHTIPTLPLGGQEFILMYNIDKRIIEN